MSLDKKKLLLIGVGVLVAILVGYYGWRYYQGRKAGGQVADAAKDHPGNAPTDKNPQGGQGDKGAEDKGTIYELSVDDIPAILAKERNLVIMVYSPDCGFCHKMAPELDKAAVNYHGCTWSRVNAKAFPQAVQHLRANVSGFPTIIHYVDGFPVNVMSGYRPAQKLIQDVQNPPARPQ
jgi:thioredoxin-like negative regulator of GroEL